MRRILLALALAALPGVALASPPAAGTTYTFYDPVFAGTVFCDTVDQVREIATADSPQDAFLTYFRTRNDRNEPVCAAVTPTAEVLGASMIGVMHRNGLHFNAWAVEIKVDNEITGYALYLERFDMVIA